MPKEIRGFKISEKHQGGMAIVYKGTNAAGFSRAFKMVRPDKAANNARLCTNFLKGITILKQLDHPNIVKAQDAFMYTDDEDKNTYTVLEMEWLNGVDLQQYVERFAKKGMTPDEVRKICMQALEGLAYAHSKNILHLDIKPSNLFRTTDGFIKIIDFGISKIIGESADCVEGAKNVTITTATGESTFKGSIAYASPEQWRGEAVTKTSDIYSFGRTMHFLLTGSDNINAEIKDEELKAIIKKCCNNFPNERYQSFSEVKNAFIHGEGQKCINPDCGKILEKGTKFCPFCGMSQEHTAQTKQCPKCGTAINKDAVFCPNCGHDFSEKPKEKVLRCKNCGYTYERIYNDNNTKCCCMCGSRNLELI